MNKQDEEILELRASNAELLRRVAELEENKKKDDAPVGVYIDGIPEYYREFIINERKAKSKG